ncbi:GMC family oxidoreductase [Ancylobacter dichloromethanicus]
MNTDILILGGGSAGCVLAARLSESPQCDVILVEAGRNIAAGDIPDEVRSRYPGRAYLDTSNLWSGLTALMGDPAGRAGRRPRRYEQARLLGGGSAINALMANRGAPGDYDEWEALGAQGWNWQACLPAFRAIEADRDIAGPLHGADGPLVLRRISDERISPFVARVMETLDRRGHPIRPDQNGAWEDGTFRGVAAIDDHGERQPTSLAYLTPEVRRRPNLKILTGHLATRLLFEGTRVVGAEVQAPGGRPLAIAARQVVVAAGAIHSPALLLRSGIGPAEELRALGVPIVADRRGVGRNLMEHPSIAVATWLPRPCANAIRASITSRRCGATPPGWTAHRRATCTPRSCRARAGIRSGGAPAACSSGSTNPIRVASCASPRAIRRWSRRSISACSATRATSSASRRRCAWVRRRCSIPA